MRLEENIISAHESKRIDFGPGDSVILASFKLPLNVFKNAEGKWETSETLNLLYPALFNLRKKTTMKIRWVGWPGVYPANEKERGEIEELLQ